MHDNRPITARTFPIGEDGKFQSEPAEAAYREACRVYPFMTRYALQHILTRYAEAEDRCRAEREEAFVRKAMEGDEANAEHWKGRDS